MKKKKATAKKKTAKPDALAKMFFRWPPDWRERAERLKRDDETMVQFLLSILQPILSGETRLIRDEDNGSVVRFEPGKKYRPALSPPQSGTGRKPDNERANKMYAFYKKSKSIPKTAAEFGCSPSNVRRIFSRCEFEI